MKIKGVLLVVLILVINACATHDLYVNPSHTNQPEQDKEIEHTFYLLGDAGYSEKGETTLPLVSLKFQLNDASKKSTVLFLGDNIYPKGMPKKDSKNYEVAKHRLKNQIKAVKKYKGDVIFIPGNHDYKGDGVKGLKREQEYVQKHLKKKSFKPTEGCAFEKVSVSKDVVLLVIDSQWYLENWDNNPTMNDNCDIRTRKDLFIALESEIKKNTEKTIVIALHHPLLTDGPHSGNHSMEQHLKPDNKTPLPGLGTAINFLRKTSGISPQDIHNRNNRHLRKRIATIAQNAKNVIFVSGHEHSLQYLEEGRTKQIVSGSGSKKTALKPSAESLFGYGGLGYAILKIYKDGSSRVSFIETESGSEKVLFEKEIYGPDQYEESKEYPNDFPEKVKASVYPLEKTEKGSFYKKMLGLHYRDAFGKSIEVATVNLDTLYGGLKPIKRGGGNQSVSLRLKDKKGKQYVMRALKKNAIQFLQITAYQEKYMKEDLEGTVLVDFIDDVYTTTHPYASFIMPTLSEAIDVYHTKPFLYYVPKQNALGVYNLDYGDALYMIEEHVGDTQKEAKNFGQPDDIISSFELFDVLHKNPKHKVDEKAYVRARLFDLILGDWDRHQDQWRWSKFKNGDEITYKPIPRDRDQVFSDYDGFVFDVLTRLMPAVKKMQRYNPEIVNLKKHLTNGFPVDLKIVKTLSLGDFYKEAEFIKSNLTNKVIDDAFSQFPEEVQNDKLQKVKSILKYRRDNILNITKSYHDILYKNVILTATNKSDDIQVTRFDDGATEVTFSYKKNTYFKAKYYREHTSTIWIYALDGEDKVVVSGNPGDCIPVKIVGGQNNDKYIIKNGTNVEVFDYKSKENRLKETSNARVTLTDEYNTNVYDLYKRKTIINKLIPVIGSNPDDGLFIGVRNTLEFSNIRRKPFTHSHKLDVSFYTFTQGYDLLYKGIHTTLLNDYNTFVELNMTSPNYANNYFGYGNDQRKGGFVLDYYRYKIATYSAAVGLSKFGNQGGEADLKLLFESKKIAQLPGRYLSTLPNVPSTFYIRDHFIGLENNIEYKNYDDNTFPTLGMHLEWKNGIKTNLENKNFTHIYTIPSISFTHYLIPNKKLVLASKFKYHLILGNPSNLKIYQMATIGGDDGLRGFNNERFTGRRSSYLTTDLRYNFRKLQTGVIPMNLGFFGGFDMGRVWVTNDTSNTVHTSVGGGAWLKAAELITGQMGLFFSSDGPRFTFGIGFKI